MSLFSHPINLIDCTFRDGGYYTNWVFEQNLVEDTLAVLSHLPVEYVEIGFRQFVDDESGALGYSEDAYLNTLKIPSNVKIALMAEEKYLRNYSFAEQCSLFPKAEKTPVQLIRLSCVLVNLEKIIPIAQYIQDQGYLLSVNVIHISKHQNDFEKHIRHLNKINAEMFYLADTFGDLKPKEITELFQKLIKNTDKPIGFHSHDNRGLALSNIIAAIDAGATWVDGTILGMGRGAGNISLECLLVEMLEMQNPQFNISPLIDLIGDKFIPLHQHHQWGYNSHYHLGSVYGVHPTEVQDFIKQNPHHFEKFLKNIRKESNS